MVGHHVTGTVPDETGTCPTLRPAEQPSAWPLDEDVGDRGRDSLEQLDVQRLELGEFTTRRDRPWGVGGM
jgi:hypothetical protein